MRKKKPRRTLTSALRYNPDANVRRLQRLYEQDPTIDSLAALNAALERINMPLVWGGPGIPRVFYFGEGWNAQSLVPDNRIISSATMSHDGWWGVGHMTREDAKNAYTNSLGNTKIGKHCWETPGCKSFRELPKPTRDEVIKAHMDVVKQVLEEGLDSFPEYNHALGSRKNPQKRASQPVKKYKSRLRKRRLENGPVFDAYWKRLVPMEYLAKASDVSPKTISRILHSPNFHRRTPLKKISEPNAKHASAIASGFFLQVTYELSAGSDPVRNAWVISEMIKTKNTLSQKDISGEWIHLGWVFKYPKEIEAAVKTIAQHIFELQRQLGITIRYMSGYMKDRNSPPRGHMTFYKNDPSNDETPDTPRRRKNPTPDESFRQAERARDRDPENTTKLIIERLRTGVITKDAVLLAARIGSPEALSLVQDTDDFKSLSLLNFYAPPFNAYSTYNDHYTRVGRHEVFERLQDLGMTQLAIRVLCDAVRFTFRYLPDGAALRVPRILDTATKTLRAIEANLDGADAASSVRHWHRQCIVYERAVLALQAPSPEDDLMGSIITTLNILSLPNETLRNVSANYFSSAMDSLVNVLDRSTLHEVPQSVSSMWIRDRLADYLLGNPVTPVEPLTRENPSSEERSAEPSPIFTIRINTATDVSTNLGERNGVAMTLLQDGKRVTTYWGKTVKELFADYEREFADENMWDRDEARAFLFLTQVLEFATLHSNFTMAHLPLEASCGGLRSNPEGPDVSFRLALRDYSLDDSVTNAKKLATACLRLNYNKFVDDRPNVQVLPTHRFTFEPTQQETEHANLLLSELVRLSHLVAVPLPAHVIEIRPEVDDTVVMSGLIAIGISDHPEEDIKYYKSRAKLIYAEYLAHWAEGANQGIGARTRDIDMAALRWIANSLPD